MSCEHQDRAWSKYWARSKDQGQGLDWGMERHLTKEPRERHMGLDGRRGSLR